MNVISVRGKKPKPRYLNISLYFITVSGYTRLTDIRLRRHTKRIQKLHSNFLNKSPHRSGSDDGSLRCRPKRIKIIRKIEQHYGADSYPCVFRVYMAGDGSRVIYHLR